MIIVIIVPHNRKSNNAFAIALFEIRMNKAFSKFFKV